MDTSTPLTKALAVDQRVKTLLWASLVLSVLLGPLVVLEDSQPAGRLVTGILVLSYVLVLVVVQVLAYRGHIRAAGIMATASWFAIFAGAIATFEGVRNPFTSGLILSILIAGLILGKRGATVMGLLAGLVVVGVWMEESLGLLPFPGHARLTAGHLLGALAGVSTTAVLTWFAARAISEALQVAGSEPRSWST